MPTALIQQNEMCDATKETELVKREGNSDDKFLPLVQKHKGIFKDAMGID